MEGQPNPRADSSPNPEANEEGPPPLLSGDSGPLLRSMGRRAPVTDAEEPRGHQVRRPAPPQPAALAIARSFMLWLVTISRTLLAVAWDNLRGRHNTNERALRVRSALERMGSTGAKIGRQLAMRIDLMPLEFSLQLAAIHDRRPPMPIEVAMARVQESIGRPLSEVFEAIDPEPIASSTVDCVYQASLRTGERVAVKVRREGIRSQILADLQALGWITSALEALALVRPGFFDHLRAELVDLAQEELDFVLQARSQTLFRQRASRDDIDWLSAPKVFQELSNGAVMVSELVGGVRCSEVIDAVVKNDAAALARLEQMNIHPKIVARRLLQAHWWGIFENLFFLAQPAPENIVVSPGDQLIFLSFEDRGTLAVGRRRQYEQMLQRMTRDDVSGAAQVLVAMLSPLPFIDTYDFTKRVESGLWEHLFAMRDKEADWWERTTIGIWRTVIGAARGEGVTLRLEVLRVMRASIMFEMMAARLNPGLRFLKEFERYQIRADRRAARRFMEDLERQKLDDLEASLVARAARVTEGLSRLGLWVESAVENLPIGRLALSGKAAYVASQVLRLVVTVLTITLGGAALRALVTAESGERLLVKDHALIIAQHPMFGLVVFVLFAVTLRRVLYRLDDKGED